MRDREKHRAKCRENYRTKREYRLQHHHEWYIRNAEVQKAKAILRRQQLKIEIFKQYGGLKCISCNEQRLGALTIDHIDQNGAEHRRHINQSCGGNRFYYWLRRNKFPSGYRVLCSNCNWLAHLAQLQIKLKISYKTNASRRHNARVKNSIMELLSGKCNNCGIADIRILTIHHINNDGAKHRRSINGVNRTGGGLAIYKAIIRSNNLNGLKCLCRSCNDNLEWSINQ